MKKNIHIIVFILIPCFLFSNREILIDFSSPVDPNPWEGVGYFNNGMSRALPGNFYIKKGGNPSTGDKKFTQTGFLFPAGDRDSFVVLHPGSDTGPGGAASRGMGWLDNISVLKSIGIRVYSPGAPASISVILQDGNKEDHIFFLGYLDFTGWREIIWANPMYINEVRSREAAQKQVKDEELPYYKLTGILIRNEMHQEYFYPAYLDELKYDFPYIQNPRLRNTDYRKALEKITTIELEKYVYENRFQFSLFKIEITYDLYNYK